VQWALCHLFPLRLTEVYVFKLELTPCCLPSIVPLCFVLNSFPRHAPAHRLSVLSRSLSNFRLQYGNILLTWNTEIKTKFSYHFNLTKQTWHPSKNRLKCKICLHAMKAYRRSRGIAPLILKLVATCRWVVNITPRPLHIRKEFRYALSRKLLGHQSQCGCCREENIAPIPEFEPRNFKPIA
jgi:hypothetical protein